MQPFEPEQLPPKDLDWVALVSAMGRANRSIAELNGLFYGLPNPEILLSPMTTQEAVLSSKIEGTQADFEEVLKFEAGNKPSETERLHDIKEIQNYREALRLSKRLLEERPFCLNSLLKLHEKLMDSVRGHNKGRGRFRESQNWIGAPGSRMEEAAFVPPSPLNLQEHLNRWEAYWHDGERDALVQLALIHAQFEILHPFLDGNGRLGRMIIPLFLFEKKILSRPSFYLSAFFEARREEYMERLRKLGQPESWTQWCLFFLEGVAEQAQATTEKARAIQDLYEKLKQRVIGLTHSQYAVPLLDFMFERPIFRASDVAKRKGMPSAPTVANLLKAMRNDKILQTVDPGAGARSSVLALGELMNLCEGRRLY